MARTSCLVLPMVLVGCAVGHGGADGGVQATFASASGNEETTADGSSSSDETGVSTGESSGASTDVDDSSTESETEVGPLCGNGELDATEECDDGNEALCDGCEDCRVRTSVLLDGVSSLIQIDDADGALALLSTPFTVEAWMRVDAMGDTVHVLRRGSSNTGWRVSMNENGLVGTVFSGFDHIENGLALVGTGWHHVAWSYDLAVSRLFLDGELVGTMESVAPVLQPDRPMRIGAWVEGDGSIVSYRRGRVDEVRVSSSVRYDGAFPLQRRFEPDAATVLLLHLDEGTGTTVNDTSAADHPGTGTNLTWEPEDGYGVPLFCE